MARAFVTASSRYMLNGAAAATAVPITLACWLQASSLAGGTQALVPLGHDSGVGRWELSLVNNAVWSRNGGTSLSGTAGLVAATNTWYHGAATFSAGARNVYFNGALDVPAAAGAAQTVNRTALGASFTAGAAANF